MLLDYFSFKVPGNLLIVHMTSCKKSGSCYREAKPGSSLDLLVEQCFKANLQIHTTVLTTEAVFSFGHPSFWPKAHRKPVA